MGSISAGTENANQFTRAQAFGTLLTLQICQITQPFGSLLNRQTGGWLWRCNPVGSFVEGWIIIWVLSVPLWGRIEKTLFPHHFTRTYGQNLALMTSTRHRWYAGPALLLMSILTLLLLPLSIVWCLAVVSWKRFSTRLSKGRPADETKLAKSSSATYMREMYDVAAAILLLRGAMGSDEDTELVEKLLKLAEDSVREVEGANGANANAEAGDTHRERRLPTASSSAVDSAVVSQEEGRRNVHVHPAASQTPQDSTLPENRSDPGRQNLLQRAYGSNAIAHREGRIDTVTMCTLIIMIVKISAVRGAGWFYALAFPPLFGCIVVQSLLLLFHSREMRQSDMENAMAIAGDIHKSLGSQLMWWHDLFFYMHGPLLAYLSYIVVFKFHKLSALKWMENTISTLMAGASMVAATLSLIGAFTSFIYLIIQIGGLPLELLQFGFEHADIRGKITKVVVFSVFIVLCLWVALGCVNFLDNFQHGGYLTIHAMTDGEPMFDHSFLNFMVDEAFRGAVLGLLTLTLLLNMWPFCFLLLDGTRQKGKDHFVSFTNVLVMIAITSWYLVTYQSEGTAKPNWVDWLG